ncbi:MAG TPA: anthranilate phosphoribosyltransferase [Myxococcota bacterium]|nr:anthranilate phosphoribosyltransferase [Myxococcota bacterium]
MSLRAALERAVQGEEIPAAVLEAAFGEIIEGKASPIAIAALLVALRTKGETPGEIVAVARALRARAVLAPCVDPRTVDTCGTGGDGVGSFNISTAAAFVVAGAGVPVAKHGNRAATSRAGSIDVLEALGVRADLPVATSARILERVGIAPFFARRAHPAMRYVAPVRQELGVRTLMNCLGPLLNPVGVKRQLVGVYAAGLVATLATALGALGAERALVVHGEDGLDEITTTAKTRASLLDGGQLTELVLDAAELGLPRARLEDLCGGDARENAMMVRAVLSGEPGPRRDIVVLNAAAALWVAGAARGLAEGLVVARESIDSGAASARLAFLVRATAEAQDGA